MDIRYVSALLIVVLLIMLRCILGGIIGGGSYFIDDHLIEEEAQIAYDYYYSALGGPCNYTDYELYMVPFWEEYFNSRGKIHSNRHFDLMFNHRYHNIYVAFDEEFDQTEKIVYRFGQRDNNSDTYLIPLTINKAEQRKREMSRCFSGGPIECSKAGKCVCMNNPDWIETVLMDEVTGRKLANQDPVFKPKGRQQACGVILGKRCYRRSHWFGKMIFDCVDYSGCHDELNMCIPQLKFETSWGLWFYSATYPKAYPYQSVHDA